MVRWIGPTTGHNELVEKSFLGRYNRTIGGLLQAVQDRFLSFVGALSARFPLIAVQREPLPRRHERG